MTDKTDRELLEPAGTSEWRLLERGEKIQRGDQGLNDDCETWHEVIPFVCNIPYVPGFFVPIRRKVCRAAAAVGESSC